MQFDYLLQIVKKKVPFLSIAVVLVFAGCSSTPYRDDYAKHINILTDKYFDKTDFKFSFVENSKVDLHGIYSQDDTVAPSSILYQGGAGFIGLLVQIGAHSSIVQSQRNEKLAEQQE